MKKQTWVLGPETKQEDCNVPFIVGGLYCIERSYYILGETLDGYFLLNLVTGVTWCGTMLNDDLQEDLNTHATLVSESIKIEAV